jgi:hypothetical protein
MPGQLAPVAQVQQEIRSYSQRKEIAKQQIRDKLGEEILMRQRNETITWKVIEESHADVEKDATDLGVQGMNLYEYSHGEVFGKLFLLLTFPGWTQKLELLNTAIEQKNSKNPKSQRVRIYSESEFLVCLGPIVGAPEYGVKGSSLWQNSIGKKTKVTGNQLCLIPTLIASFLNTVFASSKTFSPSSSRMP